MDEQLRSLIKKIESGDYSPEDHAAYVVAHERAGLRVPAPKAFRTDQDRLAWLESKTTHYLLGLLGQTRKFNGSVAIYKWARDFYYTRDEIKAVLATRPHLPNKKERQAIRKENGQAKAFWWQARR